VLSWIRIRSLVNTWPGVTRVRLLESINQSQYREDTMLNIYLIKRVLNRVVRRFDVICSFVINHRKKIMIK